MVVGHLGEVLEIVVFHVEMDFKLAPVHVQILHPNMVVKTVPDNQWKRNNAPIIPALVSIVGRVVLQIKLLEL